MGKARLGDVVFDVVQEESIGQQAEVPDNAVEDGRQISDHVKRRPLTLSITAVLTGSNWRQRRQRLQEMYDSDELARYVGREIHENMVIQTLSPDYSNAVANGVILKIVLQQVQVARVEIREFYEPDPVTETEPEPPEPEPDLRQPEVVEADEETMDSWLVAFLRKLGLFQDEDETASDESEG